MEDEQAKAAELAKKLANPIAALISVPIQNNFDWGAGPSGAGFQYMVNIQQVVFNGTLIPEMTRCQSMFGDARGTTLLSHKAR